MTILLPLLLSAISAVESGNNDLAVGRANERSRFQISEYVWQQHATAARADSRIALAVWTGDFAKDAADPDKAAIVAELHVLWLAKQLEAQGRPVTAETLALAWNAGLAGSKHPPAGSRDYAARVAALYDEAYAARPRDFPEHLKDLKLPPLPKYPEP